MSRDPLHDPTLTPEQCRPVGLDLKLDEQVLTVTWADGATSVFPAMFLRRHCPCAGCRTEREKRSESLLPILKSDPSGEIRAAGGHLVGNYALQIEWSDGHNTGIYDFRLLRTLHAHVSRDNPGAGG